MKKEKIVELVWFLVVLVIFIFSIKFLIDGELERRVEALGLFAPIFLVFLKAMTLVIAPLGGSPLYVLSGAIFGSVKGFLLSLSGDILGSTICFFISRRYGERVLGMFIGNHNVPKVLSVVNIIENTKTFAKARLGFSSMPELLAYASGLSRINFWTFTLINTAFYVPMDLALVFLGDQIKNLGIKYFFVLPIIIFLITIVGFAMLYKDYEKRESM